MKLASEYADLAAFMPADVSLEAAIRTMMRDRARDTFDWPNLRCRRLSAFRNADESAVDPFPRHTRSVMADEQR